MRICVLIFAQSPSKVPSHVAAPNSYFQSLTVSPKAVLLETKLLLIELRV